MKSFKINSYRMMSEDPDIEFLINIDENGNLTTPYPVVERENDFAMMLTREEFLKEAGKKFYDADAKLIPVAVEYGKYRDIQDEAVALGGKLPKTIAQTQEEEAEKEKILKAEKVAAAAAPARKQMTAEEANEMIRCRIFDAEDAAERHYLGVDEFIGLGY